MNLHAVRAIYMYEMARTGRTLFQSIVSPVISTSLYFIVFGAAIGSRITQIEGVNYGSFIVPGLIMLMLLTQSVTNAAFGIYFPRFVGTIYEMLSAPVSPFEIVLGYVGAAASKSIILGVIILATPTSPALPAADDHDCQICFALGHHGAVPVEFFAPSPPDQARLHQLRLMAVDAPLAPYFSFQSRAPPVA